MNNWAANLTRGLAHWIVYQQCVNFTTIPEGAVQLTAESLLRSSWSGHMISNYALPFMDKYKVKPGRPKQADIALYKYKDFQPIAIFEVKSSMVRQNRKAQFIENDIITDLVRLAICSGYYGKDCKCFLITAGSLLAMKKVLSTYYDDQCFEISSNESIKVAKKIVEHKISELNFINDYDKLVKKYLKDTIYFRLRRRGFAGNIKNRNIAVYLWQVAHNKKALEKNIDNIFEQL